jgi:hypothetical protein
MIAVELVVRLLDFSLASKGPSTHGGRRRAKSDSNTGRANAGWYETPADGIAAGREGLAYKPA